MRKKVKIVNIEQEGAKVYELDTLPFEDGYELVYKNIPERGEDPIFSKEEFFSGGSGRVGAGDDAERKREVIRKVADIVLFLTIAGALLPLLIILIMR